MMLRHQLAVTAVALTLVGVGVTGTGFALMPQPGGNGPPVPPAAAAKKDDPAVMMTGLTTQIATTERKLAEAVEQWKASMPKVAAGELRAKAELLGAINLLIFKSQVEIRKIELQIEPFRDELERIRKSDAAAASITDEELVSELAFDLIIQRGSFIDKKSSEAYQGFSETSVMYRREIQRLEGTGDKAIIAKVNARHLMTVKKYLETIAWDQLDFSRLYRSVRKRQADLKIDHLKGLIHPERVTLGICMEERRHVEVELAKLEAVPPEPAAVVALRQELATLTANREAFKAQHPGTFDPATRSAVAMEGLLHELVELRGEVKKLRDGK